MLGSYLNEAPMAVPELTNKVTEVLVPDPEYPIGLVMRRCLGIRRYPLRDGL